MGKLTITKTPLAGILLVVPQYFKDSRGFFVESYNKKDFSHAGITDEFVQDNHSKSQKGVLRGLHYQYPHAQGKLVRVLKGSIYDVAVDIRIGSPTYGKPFAVTLRENDPAMLYIPVGFAHGFLALEDDTEVMYKVTDLYYPSGDAGLLWNDPDLNIPWPLDIIGIKEPILSEKDTKHPILSELRSPFTYV
ncbi:dTDP-4-dehydrorhamnose 3,5-epimerase [Methanospirillum hungatei JF-1]|uniref:dTDP-4-dehydrorhamnose 3,5-epimerase n=1 Tax=Methanospirillum hungatei JF-1 (strain ATCC 27890 / DSM 864 / NBRC 100397 / JF-1) TaxID=323259 RepID=Q2FRS6_METHJ|nr:dTDP-4-dehydrorhamnose 3,5-epimerase [Methanospirillum hungatei]ABD42761.1 dTDP-4-dehydrorhamnose 3,5-epimerase [Methanospirillum hungatei JF-1]